MSLSLFGLGLGWSLAYVAATTELVDLAGAVRARAADRPLRPALVASAARLLALGGGVVYTGAGGSVPLALAPAAWRSSRPPGWPDTGPLGRFLPRAPAPDGCYHSRPADLLVGPFLRMKTYNAKPGEIQRDWYLVDAEGKTLAGSRRRSPTAARQDASRSTRRTSTPATSSSSSTPRRSRSRATSSTRRCTTGTPAIPAACKSARCASSSTGSRPRCCARRSRACSPQQARPRPTHQAQDLRRPGASARGAGTDHSGGVALIDAQRPVSRHRQAQDVRRARDPSPRRRQDVDQRQDDRGVLPAAGPPHARDRAAEDGRARGSVRPPRSRARRRPVGPGRRGAPRHRPCARRGQSRAPRLR